MSTAASGDSASKCCSDLSAQRWAAARPPWHRHRRSVMTRVKTAGRRISGATGLVLLASLPALAQAGAPAQRSAAPAKATLAIVGGMLIDGRGGEPLQRAVVLIDGKKISAVGTTDTLKVPPGVKVIDAAGYTVLGGLTDAHVHLDFLGHADYVAFHKAFSAMGAVGERVAAASARQLLMAGVTTAVDLGGAPETQVHIRDRINR